jgi:hypothetical protein
MRLCLAVFILMSGLITLRILTPDTAFGQAPTTPALPPPAVAPAPLTGYGPASVYAAEPGAAPGPYFQLSSKEHELERQSQTLAQRYAKTENRDEREKVRDELNKVLQQQFDAQQERRKAEIERVEAQLKKLRELMQKREDSKRSIVSRRLEQLLQDAEGLGWTGAGSGPATTTLAPVAVPPASTRPR